MLIVERILQVVGVPWPTVVLNKFRWLMAWGVVRCERPCQRKRVYRELEWLTAWRVVRCERPCWERECTEESSGDSRPEVWWGVRGPARGREHTAGGRSPGEQPGGTGRPAGCHWGLAVPSGRSSPCTSPGNPAIVGENDVIILYHLPAQESQWKTMSHHTVSLHFAADVKHTTLHKANIFNRQTCNQ